jgi:twitching motility protein PilT
MQLNQKETGMVTQTQQLLEFVQKRLVSRSTAISYANRAEELIRVLDANGL